MMSYYPLTEIRKEQYLLQLIIRNKKMDLLTLLLLHVCVPAIETFISSAEKKGDTPDILLSSVFSASFNDVSASLSEDSIILST